MTSATARGHVLFSTILLLYFVRARTVSAAVHRRRLVPTFLPTYLPIPTLLYHPIVRSVCIPLLSRRRVAVACACRPPLTQSSSFPPPLPRYGFVRARKSSFSFSASTVIVYSYNNTQWWLPQRSLSVPHRSYSFRRTIL